MVCHHGDFTEALLWEQEVGTELGGSWPVGCHTLLSLSLPQWLRVAVHSNRASSLLTGLLGRIQATGHSPAEVNQGLISGSAVSAGLLASHLLCGILPYCQLLQLVRNPPSRIRRFNNLSSVRGSHHAWSSVLKSLLAVCICTHLSVSSVESYACDNRKCYNGRCESYQKCQSTKGCFFHVQELKESNNPFGSLKIKEISCSEDECTELAFSTTLGGQRTFSYDHQCCYTEQCNTMSKRDDSFPSSQPQPNGVECPACYSEDGKCEPVPLKCTGLETKCVVVFGTDCW
ncbi:protein RoBo-1-like isoform X2 [Peromyscus leucopus]|uniref:protein RoBo-1-like isoform X2 n=1 Tax=Peromyscus leucopus TaxID=10041 RepID=UPI0018849040|nr:protein RoBo-1-like isoform X2 [Peromyscus leucopus]